jgi:hypothetical protein
VHRWWCSPFRVAETTSTWNISCHVESPRERRVESSRVRETSVSKNPHHTPHHDRRRRLTMPFPLERSNRNLSIPMTNATTEDSSPPSGVVRIPYHDLVAAASCRSGGDGATTTNDTAAIHQLIEEAFSSSGLGIVAITDVPNLSRLRLELLPLAQNLASLSSEQLEEITVPESDYQVGWVSVYLSI